MFIRRCGVILWDLVDDGREDSVLRLRDMGRNGISVATADHTFQ